MMNLIASFQDFHRQFPAATSDLGQKRQQASENFQKLGLPTKADENWHYTSVKALSELNFKLALLQRGAQSSEDLNKYLGDDFHHIVFVDGKFVADLSKIDGLQKYLNFSVEAARVETGDTAFEQLNRSYAHQGLVLQIPPGVAVDKPVQILSYVTANEVMTQPYCRVLVGARSKLALVESYAGFGSAYFQNSVVEIEVGEAAKLEYLRLQNDTKTSFNTGKTQIKLAKQSSLESLSVSLGGKLGRHDFQVSLRGPEASAKVNGITLGFDEQHLDHSTLITHEVGEGTTSQLYKAVLGDKSRSVFTGKVIIQKGAQKAASEQLNNNLLLSRDAEADSRPQLEILADDVKATHGSTVGQLNEEELFYLLSRAISKTEAIEMLSVGFLQELVFKISDEIMMKYLNRILLETYRKGGKT